MRITIHGGVFLRLVENPEAKADIWCLHGFGESWLCYREIFDSPLAREYNIYVPDLPGFGVSPAQAGTATMNGQTDVAEMLIRQVSGDRPVVIIGHSLAGVVGTRLAQRLGEQVLLYINIEGNLTKEDAYFSGMSAKHEDAREFYKAFREYAFSLTTPEGALHRYYASLRFANPEALHTAGKSCFEASDEFVSGEEFRRLDCPKIYYWSRAGTADETRDFLTRWRIPNRCFEGADPWLMAEFGEWLYRAIAEDLPARESEFEFESELHLAGALS